MLCTAIWNLRPFTISYKRGQKCCPPKLSGLRAFSKTDVAYRKRQPHAERETIFLLRREGKTAPEIADMLGTISVDQINGAYRRFCKAEGYDDLEKKIRLTNAQHDEISQMRRDGRHWHEIAPRFGKSFSAINKSHRRWLRRSAEHVPRRWTDDEENYLVHAHDELGKPWSDIAKTLQRSIEAVAVRYNKSSLRGRSNRVRHPTMYTEAELEMLESLRDKEKLSWKEISERMPGRSPNQKYYRIRRERASQSDKIFTSEEDQQLKDLRGAHGLTWAEVAESMPSRSPEVLRRRYKYLLRLGDLPNNKRAP